jgi:hypothetical protein
MTQDRIKIPFFFKPGWRTNFLCMIEERGVLTLSLFLHWYSPCGIRKEYTKINRLEYEIGSNPVTRFCDKVIIVLLTYLSEEFSLVHRLFLMCHVTF